MFLVHVFGFRHVTFGHIRRAQLTGAIHPCVAVVRGGCRSTVIPSIAISLMSLGGDMVRRVTRDPAEVWAVQLVVPIYPPRVRTAESG